MEIEDVFKTKGYIAALQYAIILGFSLAEAEDLVGKMRLEMMRLSEAKPSDNLEVFA